MKTVQSLWFNKNSNSINYNAGWLDVRYHLMSWALSSISLKNHTDSIELITDSVGYELLIDKLALPYSSVNLLFDTYQNPLSDLFWALKKIEAYGIHDEPFIFVDGDVYNFNPNFAKDKKLFAQNFEINFSFYYPVQSTIKELCNISGSYLERNQLDAINTGIIGGTDYVFFKKFRNEIFNFTSENENSLYKIVNEYQIEAKYVNVWLEQYFLNSYSTYCGKKFSFLLENKIKVEDDYRYLADFTNLPSPNNFMHLMHLTKINPTVCEQLAQRLYIESPEKFERVEDVCRQLKATHHYIYSESVLYRPSFARTNYLLQILCGNDISLNEEYAFVELKKLIDAIDTETHRVALQDSLNYEKNILDFKDSLPHISLLKQNWRKNSIVVNNTLSLPISDLLISIIRRGQYSLLLESEWNWAERNEYAGQLEHRDLVDNLAVSSSYYEVLLYIYIHENIIREHLLDALNMLILDALQEPTSINSVIAQVCEQVLAYQPELNQRELAETVLSRIRHFLYHGVLEVVE